MDDYENYYNEAIKEIRRLRIVVREYQEDINLLNASPRWQIINFIYKYNN